MYHFPHKTEKKFISIIIIINIIIVVTLRSRDSVAGTATRYGLEGPGIEYRLGRDFPHLSRPALRPTQPLMQWVQGL